MIPPWDGLFWLAHAAPALGWTALLLPVGSFQRRRRLAIGCGAAAALGYAVLFFGAPDAAVLVSDYSLSGVAAFFDVPRLQLAGWIHYLVLDLWAGIWESDEADRTGMSRWLLVPSLVTTALVGPVGLLLFLVCSRLGREAR
jgi:ABA DEFICIENT 4-like